MSQALQMRGRLGICSDSSCFRVSQWALLTRGTAQSHPPAQSEFTYSASSLEICFPKYKTSAIRDTMGSQFRLAAAVTWPSLEGKEEECGSSQST